MTNETTNSRPTHRAYAVTKRGGKSHWTEIGAAWTNKDGKGFNLALNLLPLTPDTEIVVRVIEAKADAAPGEGGSV